MSQIGYNPNTPQATPTQQGKSFNLGDRYEDDDGNVFVYVQANGAVTGPGYTCFLTAAYQAAMVSTSNDLQGLLLAIPPAAFADNDYGWMQVYGVCDVRVAASCAANVPLNTTATAGQLDDDATAGALVATGLVLSTERAASAGLAPAVLNWPAVGSDAAAAAAAATLAGLTATATEINNVADVSTRVQIMTVSGAVTAGIQSIELDHATVAIEATIATAVNMQGMVVIKDTSATGTAAHTVTLTAGTYNGTATVATFDARDEALFVYFDSAGRGQIIANVGGVGLS